MGVIYNMTEIEPAYYLVVSQLVLHKDLRHASMQSLKNHTSYDMGTANSSRNPSTIFEEQSQSEISNNEIQKQGIDYLQSKL